ncbi:MAG: response regulator transcription factor [Pseudohongiella sp.]|nr:response regulator transcription factor [Pseudohongiella sp.]MDO9519092.1 response regulator transcription factor [Pseudohongiella sp.]
MDVRKSIVIVEDDKLYGRVLDYQLNSLGYHCTLINSGHRLLEELPSLKLPDLFIFDYFLGLDEPTGLTLCRHVQSFCDVPIMVLTGNNKLETLVSCLKAGADQYIHKPCDIRELDARIIASLRKAPATNSGKMRELKLQLDKDIGLQWSDQMLRHSNGTSVKLTDKEIGLLELFVNSPERYIERDDAFQVLYGYEMQPSNRSIDVLAGKLRKKLAILDPGYIVRTMRGRGYALVKAQE